MLGILGVKYSQICVAEVTARN